MLVKKNIRKLILIVICFCYSINIYSQVYKLKEKWLLNLNIGSNAFYGDVTDNKNKIWHNSPFSKYFYEDRKTMYGFIIGKEFNPSFAIKSQFLWGSLYSRQDSKNRYFKADLFELNLHISANLLTILTKKDDRVFDIYAFLGLGITSFRTIAFQTNPSKFINSYGYTHYGAHQAKAVRETQVPLGLGLSYKLGEHWKINAETSLRYVNTDKLDAVKDKSSSIEGYSYNAIGVSYIFNIALGEIRLFNKRKFSGFKSQQDKTSKIYNRGTSNGNIKTDPFKSHRKNKNYVYKKKNRKKFLGIF
ncbi:MAG: outer membrane beta-barrel protein [Bacteroidota bacterium]